MLIGVIYLKVKGMKVTKLKTVKRYKPKPWKENSKEKVPNKQQTQKKKLKKFFPKS